MNYLEQLTFITDEISQDFEHTLKFAKEYGIKAVELRKIWNKNIATFTTDDLQNLKGQLEEYGIGVSMISGPFAKCFLPSSRLAKKTGNDFSRSVAYNLGLFDRLVEISDYLDTPNIRLMSFFKTSLRFNKLKWDEMIGIIKEYAEKAQDNKKMLMMENEHICFVDTIEHAMQFMDEMSDSGFNSVKLNLDPGNFYSGKDSTTPEAYEELYQKGYIGYIHVKDPKRRIPFAGGIFGVVGEGKIDYQSLFKQAINHNYKGWFSLETHSVKNKEIISRKSIENMIKMLKF